MRANRRFVVPAFLAAVLCVLGPWAIPVGPVPVSLTSLWICLAAGLLGSRQGALCVLIYLLLGAAGLPVFSSFTGGAGALLGPTGGYLAGYLLLALCAGWGAGRRRRVLLAGMLGGTALLYLMGTAWFCVQTGSTPLHGVMVCVVPFLPFDAVKIAAALYLIPVLSKRLRKAGYL